MIVSPLKLIEEVVSPLFVCGRIWMVLIRIHGAEEDV